MNDHSLTIMVYCTCPDEATAASIAKNLVDKKQAACVNILPRVSSVYEWEGKICEEAETLLMIKTNQSAFDSLSTTIREHHPYELPEIIAVPISAGLPAYLDWVNSNVKP